MGSSQVTDRAWSRCVECGCVNDMEAEECYLCGGEKPSLSCPKCGSEFRTPVDTTCPSCNLPYGRQLQRSGDGDDLSTSIFQERKAKAVRQE